MIRFIFKLQRRQERAFIKGFNKTMVKAFRRLGRQYAESQSLVVPVYLKEEIKKTFKEEIATRRKRTARIIKNYLIKKGKKLKKQEELLNLTLTNYNEARAIAESTATYSRFEHIVNNVIANQFTETVNYEEIPTLFRQIESGLFIGRSRFMARNATADALTHASLESAKTIEVEHDIKLKKVWISTEDDRTREDHINADGQIVNLDEPFSVGGYSLQRPNDNLAPTEQTVNCRCTMIYK